MQATPTGTSHQCPLTATSNRPATAARPKQPKAATSNRLSRGEVRAVWWLGEAETWAPMTLGG